MMTAPRDEETTTIDHSGRRLDPGAGRAARAAIALADNRPVALIFPESRRIVLDRLRKILGADEVRLADRVEAERICGRGEPGATPAPPGLDGLSSLVDASLLSARTLRLRLAWLDAVVGIDLEGWLAAAGPDMAFFTEPGAATIAVEASGPGRHP